ncbi:hypothetical protein GQ44DRAFT_737104 [Phaeosphaeriaceae sp. PMI808]|nr:hypothetical protein GQ44DRAFT_737104 [Phaeosphaeriaceae sp. PMI808]
MAEASRKKLLISLRESLQSGNYSDLTVTCGQDIYKVHKVIVCSRTVFFANAIKFPGKESKEATVDLPEDEPEVIKLLMQYLYEGEYQPFFMESPSIKTDLHQQTTAHSCHDRNYYCQNYGTFRVCDHHICGSQCGYTCEGFECNICMPNHPKLDGTASQLLVHSKMYEIGERYDVQGLKELAKEKFRIACDEFWSTSDFPQAAHHAFSSTIADDTGLRTIVCQILANHMELIEKEEVAALLTEFNGLAYGLLKEKVAQGWK